MQWFASLVFLYIFPLSCHLHFIIFGILQVYDFCQFCVINTYFVFPNSSMLIANGTFQSEIPSKNLAVLTSKFRIHLSCCSFDFFYSLFKIYFLRQMPHKIIIYALSKMKFYEIKISTIRSYDLLFAFKSTLSLLKQPSQFPFGWSSFSS